MNPILEFSQHPVTGRHIRSANDAAALRLRANTSTWMLNIGTHRKPFNDSELQRYAESLRSAIEKVFDDEDNLTEMFYRVAPVAGSNPRTFQHLTTPVFRTREILGINSIDWTSVVETGSKTGRIDSHILLHVIHSNTLIRVDIKNFADLLQEALEEENEEFENLRIMQEDPLHQHEPLAWPKEGRPFVSFSSICRFNESGTLAYMTKQYRGQRIYDEEANALTMMGDNLAGNVNLRTGGNQTRRR